jgi:hypothetical protein
MHNSLSCPTVIDLMAAAEPPQKLLYSRRDAAYTLSISTRSLDYLIGAKQLNTLKLGRKVMIPYGELVRFATADHAHLTADPNEVVN